MKRSAILMICAAFLAGSATAAPPTHAQKFVTDAMKGDNSEVMLGQLAAERGGSDGVRSYGRTLTNDHGAHKTRLAGLANSLGVDVTEDTTPEAKAMHKQLSALKGSAFDKAFLTHMIADHRKDIAKYEAEARSGDPSSVTSLAQETLPTLKKHLATAQSLAK